jgi:hypothetical protein
MPCCNWLPQNTWPTIEALDPGPNASVELAPHRRRGRGRWIFEIARNLEGYDLSAGSNLERNG